MNTTPLTDSKLDEIAGRAASLHEYATLDDAPFQADADQLTGEDVPTLLAEIRRLRAHGAELQVGLNDLAALVSQWHSRAEKAEARVRELERPAIEAKRNEIRDSFTELAAAARETGDHEGAFEVECRLRDREEQWKREDSAATPA